jgi:hypothetical protein
VSEVVLPYAGRIAALLGQTCWRHGARLPRIVAQSLCVRCTEAVAWLRRESVPYLTHCGEFGIVFELPERHVAEFTARFLRGT